VRAVAPDVLCLQEVPRRLTTELRLPGFARECGLRWVGGRLGTGGTAVLTSSRVTVHGTVRGRLPVRFPDRTRGYAGVDVSLPGSSDQVRVVSIHLGLRAPERARHARMLLEVLGERAVVAGDLNEGSEGAAHRLLATRYRVVSGGGPTFPAARPHRVLDVVFAGPDLQVTPAADAEVAALVEADVVAASDHRPVWVDVALGG
jgi:endonuclease/exonuclease/phosphatase family metal-dependent hydrolase